MTVHRSRFAAALLLLGVFAAGTVAGGIGVTIAEHRGVGPGRNRGGRDGYVDRLTVLLDLSATQQDSIRAILQRHEPIMDSMWREVRPRFDSVRNEVRAAIRAQLTPEQRQRYNDSLERRSREDRARRDNGRR
jgi:Spy/CpxP family protein refolding chaperone